MNFQSKDFKLGLIYGRLWEKGDSSNWCFGFEEFIKSANNLFCEEKLVIESYEMMEEIIGLITSNDTEDVMIDDKKCLKIEDIDGYCYLENGMIIYKEFL